MMFPSGCGWGLPRCIYHDTDRAYRDEGVTLMISTYDSPAAHAHIVACHALARVDRRGCIMQWPTTTLAQTAAFLADWERFRA